VVEEELLHIVPKVNLSHVTFADLIYTDEIKDNTIKRNKKGRAISRSLGLVRESWFVEEVIFKIEFSEGGPFELHKKMSS
jgi:hypothetical protein